MAGYSAANYTLNRSRAYDDAKRDLVGHDGILEKSAVTGTALSKLPTIGEGLVIPRDSRFIDLDREAGELNVPAGISLQEQEFREQY